MYHGFKPGRGCENDPEVIAWAKEANVWAELYMTYTDDNHFNMVNAFADDGLYDVSAEVLHNENVSCIMSIGLDTIRECNRNEELDGYIAEAERLERLRSHWMSCGDDTVSDDCELSF